MYPSVPTRHFQTHLANTVDISIHSRDKADQFAFPMFCLSVLFLALLAGIIITWVDIPRVAELAEIDDASAVVNAHAVHEAAELASRADSIGRTLFIVLLLIWPLFWLEFAFNYQTRRGKDGARIIHMQSFLACLIPPLRLGTVSSAWNDQLWLPHLSWRTPGRALHASLDRLFSKPMLLIALLILPILLIEFVFKEAVQTYFWLRILLHLATGFIWFAFAFEFIIMVSATDKKFAYIKKNWIDLAIILIPLISFLRTLRVLRLARLAKIQKIAKLGRVYRVRSLGMKAMRAMMMFGVVNRILRITPEKRIAKLQAQLNEHQREVELLEDQIASLKVTKEA